MRSATCRCTRRHPNLLENTNRTLQAVPVRRVGLVPNQTAREQALKRGLRRAHGFCHHCHFSALFWPCERPVRLGHTPHVLCSTAASCRDGCTAPMRTHAGGPARTVSHPTGIHCSSASGWSSGTSTGIKRCTSAAGSTVFTTLAPVLCVCGCADPCFL